MSPIKVSRKPRKCQKCHKITVVKYSKENLLKRLGNYLNKENWFWVGVASQRKVHNGLTQTVKRNISNKRILQY